MEKMAYYTARRNWGLGRAYKGTNMRNLGNPFARSSVFFIKLLISSQFQATISTQKLYFPEPSIFQANANQFWTSILVAVQEKCLFKPTGRHNIPY